MQEYKALTVTYVHELIFLIQQNEFYFSLY